MIPIACKIFAIGFVGLGIGTLAIAMAWPRKKEEEEPKREEEHPMSNTEHRRMNGKKTEENTERQRVKMGKNYTSTKPVPIKGLAEELRKGGAVR